MIISYSKKIDTTNKIYVASWLRIGIILLLPYCLMFNEFVSKQFFKDEIFVRRRKNGFFFMAT